MRKPSAAAFAGVELPVTALRRQAAVTVPTDALPAATPMTIFAGDGFHLRVRDGRVLLHLANGSSGHGVMHALAIGQLVAELVLDGAATSLDVTALRPDRFAAEAQRRSELL